MTVCPHCLKVCEINVRELTDGYIASGECPHCGKRFRVEVTLFDQQNGG